MSEIVRTVRRMRRSELDALHVCMFRAKEIYEDGFTDQSEPSQRGQAFHEVVKRYVERLFAAGVPSDYEEAKIAFREGIALSMCPATLVREVHQLFFDRFVPRFELHLDAYLASEEIQFEQIVRPSVDGGEPERIDLSWVPDLVYAYPDRLRIRDWKTFWRGLSQEQADAEFQPLFYLRQASKVWPGFPLYEFEFVFVRLGTSVTVSLTPAELDVVDEMVAAVLTKREVAMQTGQWPATPGEHCRFCQLKCPVIDDPRRIPVRAQTQDEAEALAGEWLVLEKRLAAVKSALQGWCDREGAIVMNGEEFKYRARTSRRFPMAGVMDVLREHDVETAAEQITVSASSLATVLNPKRSSPDLIAGLEALRIDKQSWQLRHHKAGAFPDPDPDEEEESK